MTDHWSHASPSAEEGRSPHLLHIAPTFRDPDGFCFSQHGRVLRLVHAHAVPRVRMALASDFFRRLEAEHRVPTTRMLDSTEALATANGESQLRAALRLGGTVLEHESVRFPSYPHEWPPGMLFAAAELSLDLQLQALEAGFTLKDATPTNVLFRGPNPVFVDVLSFQPRTLGAVLWPAYAQFVRTFLLPLLLHRFCCVFPHSLLLDRPDGLEPEEVYPQLSWLQRWSPLGLRYVSVPTWLRDTTGTRQAGGSLNLKGDDARAGEVAQMLVRGLQKNLAAVRPRATRSRWSAYEMQNSYSPAALAAKAEFVRVELQEMRPARIIDIGCNTGQYALMAAGCGASVVALDSDPVVVDELWNSSRAQGADVLPLVVNLARPTPGVGWRNAEAVGFLDRARGHFDAGLMLAITHHLSVGGGIPLPEIFRLAAEFVRTGLLVEFVPPSDPMFQRLVRNKEHLILRLGQPQFEEAFAPWFRCARRLPLPDCGRVLYSLRRVAA